jgi:hypothetical protein
MFPGGKIWPGRAADPSSAEVMEERCYTSTHPLDHTGSVTGLLYLLNNSVPIFCILLIPFDIFSGQKDYTKCCRMDFISLNLG